MRKRVFIGLFVLALLAAVGTAVALGLPHLKGLLEQATEPPAAEAEQEKAVVQEKPAQPVTMAEAPVFTTTRESGLTVTAPDAFLSTQELADVEACIAELRADGVTVCVSLIDLKTRRGLTFNADEVMYPASSIKACYCTWVYETHGGSGDMSGTVANCLINSDNDAYHDLLHAFGLSEYASWLTANGAPIAAKRGYRYYYPDTTASELASLWEEIYRFGTSGKASASELTGYLAQTNFSPIAEELRDTYEVWSKPGWYPLDENDIPATNDAGIVFSDTGAYVIAIMTDMSSNLDGLKPLIVALDAAHAKMCGTDVAYYEK